MQVFTRMTLILFFHASLAFVVRSERVPNIVLIVADDLNCFIQPYGDNVAITPHLTELASRGLVFDKAYCQQAVCNPSRSSFLTGLRPNTVKVDDLRKNFREASQLGETLVTLPQFFKERGYFCQNIGKLFHNMGETQDRQSWSIDEVLHKGTHSADTIHYNTPKPLRKNQFSKAPVMESLDVPDTFYRDGQIAHLAASVLRDLPPEGKPFFLGVGFWRPHLPFVAPQKYWQQYDRSQIQIPPAIDQYAFVPSIALHDSRELWSYGNLREKQSFSEEDVRDLKLGYYASISFLDAQVGKILDAIELGGHRDNTIVVFLSDHGFHVGERGLWGKTTNFELDARVPFILSDPRAVVSHGKTSSSLCELVDLYPTLIHLCGFQAEENQVLEGADLSPLLKDPTIEIKPAAFTQHQHPFYGARDQWKAVGYSIRTAQWRYTEWRAIGSNEILAKELYDHSSDSQELTNVSHLHPEVVNQHAIELLQQFPIHSE